MLKQPQYVPMNVIDQVISIFAGSKGFMDDVPVNQVGAFEKALLAHMKGAGSGVRDELVKLRDIDKTMEGKLGEEIKRFKSGWKPGK